MAAQSGKDLLIKVDMDGTGTVRDGGGAAGHAAELQRRNRGRHEPGIDRRLARIAGRCRREIGGDFGLGRLSATRPPMNVRGRSSSTATTPDFQVVIPDFGTVEGAFQITSIEYAGSHDGEATYEMSMASAGALTFTAALNRWRTPGRARWRWSSTGSGGCEADAGRAGGTGGAAGAGSLADLVARFEGDALRARDVLALVAAGLRGGGWPGDLARSDDGRDRGRRAGGGAGRRAPAGAAFRVPG
jgi:predicted secreted protein